MDVGALDATLREGGSDQVVKITDHGWHEKDVAPRCPVCECQR